MSTRAGKRRRNKTTNTTPKKGKMAQGVCRLCRKEDFLVYSHIIQESMYKGIYDPKHRSDRFSNNVNFQRHKVIQKGLREYLLCKNCEQLIKEFEDYYYAVLFDKDKSVNKEHFNEHIIYRGVDYLKFKLCQMSMLWRTSISTLPEFSFIKLPNKHEEKLRLRILNKCPGKSWEYGTINFKYTGYLPNSNFSASDLDKNILIINDQQKRYGCPFYTFLLRGFEFNYMVSSHKPPALPDEIFICESGNLIFLKTHIKNFSILPYITNDIKKLINVDLYKRRIKKDN